MTFSSMRSPAELAELLTTALIHFVWQGAVLTLILLVVVKMMDVRAARLRYVLSVGTLLAMGLAPILTIALHQHGTAARMHSEEASDDSSAVIHERSATFSALGLHADAQTVSAAPWNPRIKICVLFGWLVGVLILSTRLAIGFGVTLWIRAKRESLSESFEQRVRVLGDRLSVDARQRVFASVRVGQAVAIGFIRPVVLIPVAWLSQLTPEMLEAVIAHELAHLRRWDLWVNLVQRVIETLLFYHPAVWWLTGRIRLEREMCCDEIAADCSDRAMYAQSLEAVARFAQGTPLLATSIHGEGQMHLLTRTRYLFGAAAVDAAGNWRAVGFVAMTIPFVAAVAFSLTAGSTPSVAMAIDGKQVEANSKIYGRQTSQSQLENTTVGSPVIFRMTGDLMKEYRRRSGMGPIFGWQIIEVTGSVERILDDGRLRIAHSSPVKSDKNRSRLITVTAIVDPLKIKRRSAPGAKKRVGPEVPQKGQNLKSVEMPALNDVKFVGLSDLKGIKIQTWELKDEVGE